MIPEVTRTSVAPTPITTTPGGGEAGVWEGTIERRGESDGCIVGDRSWDNLVRCSPWNNGKIPEIGEANPGCTLYDHSVPNLIRCLPWSQSKTASPERTVDWCSNHPIECIFGIPGLELNDNSGPGSGGHQMLVDMVGYSMLAVLVVAVVMSLVFV